MANRVQEAIDRMRPRILQLDKNVLATLTESSKLNFEEHFAYQETQAHAHAAGKITADEAMVCYQALGEGMPEDGWAAGTDLATKVVVTRMIAELMGVGV